MTTINMNLPQRLQDADYYWQRNCALYARDVISHGKPNGISVEKFFNIVSKKKIQTNPKSVWKTIKENQN